MKRIYRGFKTECPTGLITEEIFSGIYSRFFPHGGIFYSVPNLNIAFLKALWFFFLQDFKIKNPVLKKYWKNEIVDFSHVFSAPFIWTDVKGTKRHSIRPIRLSKKQKKEIENSYPSKFKGCFLWILSMFELNLL